MTITIDGETFDAVTCKYCGEIIYLAEGTAKEEDDWYHTSCVS